MIANTSSPSMKSGFARNCSLVPSALPSGIAPLTLARHRAKSLRLGAATAARVGSVLIHGRFAMGRFGTCWATPSWEGEESWAGNAILNAPGWGTARIKHTTFSFRFSLPPLSLLPTPANSPHPDSTTPIPTSLRSPHNPGARGLRAPAARYHLRNATPRSRPGAPCARSARRVRGRI